MEAGLAVVVLSDPILTEFGEKLTVKFGVSTGEVDSILERLRTGAALTHIEGKAGWVPQDPDDDKFIETALVGRAGIIVSGDRHLLTLGSDLRLLVASKASPVAIDPLLPSSVIRHAMRPFYVARDCEPWRRNVVDLGYVRRLALRLEQEGHRVADVTVQHASASDALIDLAADVPGAVLGVSTAVADPLPDALEGSTAAQLVRSCSVPVLVVRRARTDHRMTVHACMVGSFCA